MSSSRPPRRRALGMCSWKINELWPSDSSFANLQDCSCLQQESVHYRLYLGTVIPAHSILDRRLASFFSPPGREKRHRPCRSSLAYHSFLCLDSVPAAHPRPLRLHRFPVVIPHDGAIPPPRPRRRRRQPHALVLAHLGQLLLRAAHPLSGE